MEGLAGKIEGLMPMAVTWGGRVLGVLVALFILRIVARVIANRMKNSLSKRNFDEALTRFFSSMVYYAIWIVGAIGCLGVFGIQTASFAAVLAAAGLAVGLALQGTLSNFAAGVMLLIFRPFQIGNVVRAGGEIGAITDIGLFATEFTTPDNRRVIVPNSKVFGDTIENITHHSTRRVDVGVGTAYDSDVDQARKVLEAMAPQITGVLADPPPQIFLKELGASSVDWQVRVWCNTVDYWDVYQLTIRNTKKALDDAKIGIPFPQMDVHLDK